jgi:hypothetical protein
MAWAKITFAGHYVPTVNAHSARMDASQSVFFCKMNRIEPPVISEAVGVSSRTVDRALALVRQVAAELIEEKPA